MVLISFLMKQLLILLEDHDNPIQVCSLLLIYELHDDVVLCLSGSKDKFN